MQATTKLAAMLALVAALYAFGGACGGDDSDEDTPTPTPSVATQGTPEPAPTIEDSTIISPAKGYRATFPEGWNPRANLTTAGGIRADAFFAPENVGDVQPNISVTCHPKELDETRAWLDARLETLRSLERSNIQELGTTDIAGLSAERLSYEIERFGAAVNIEELIFVAGACDWIVSLTVPDGASSDYRAEFSAFVSSFELTTPVSGETT